jgi:trans-aconitate methyltransferase
MGAGTGWDAERYDRQFSFVSGYGAPLVDLLDPKPGERVVDLGCGTGSLTAAIAERGAAVTGLDGDPGMVAAARKQHPGMVFALADGHRFTVAAPVDAVFSNAALHWMTRPDEVIGSVRSALRPGGRFVAELGGAGCVATLVEGLRAAADSLGLPEPAALPWYFPTPAEYAGRLEAGGFRVRLLEFFDRPTPLAAEAGGAAGWWRMFGPSVLAAYPVDAVEPLLDRVNALTRDRLVQDGTWVADYVRLRFVAHAT